MPAKDWADDMADGVVRAYATLADTRSKVARALRYADERGYKRGCEEFLQRLVDSAHEEARQQDEGSAT